MILRKSGIAIVMTIVFNANLFPSRKKLMIKAGMDIDSEITSTDRFNKEKSKCFKR